MTATAEPLQPQDLVITLLGSFVRPSGQPVWSGGMVELLAEFGFTEGAARVALTRLVRRGLIERVRSGRLVHYRVTARCERLLAEGDGRIFTLGHPRPPGDGWTLLWHQIPDRRRLEHSRLARRLRFLGFGSVQPGFWISPHDHREEVGRLLAELGVSEFATMFLGAPHAGIDALVARAWDLSGLASRYDAFCTEFSRYLCPDGRRGPRPARQSDLGAFMVRTRLMHTFRGFPALDPELPEALAPLGAARSRAVDLFALLYDGLREPAQRHFDAVARSDVAAGPAPALA
jgi:phenylacetic acid degradation operon negative regulatory protein